MEAIIENYKSGNDELEQKFIENISDFSTNQEFFDLPLQNLLTIISKVNFSELNSPVEVISNLCKNIISKYGVQKESIFLLLDINTKDCSFSIHDIINILSNFTNSDILQKLKDLYQSKKRLPKIDYQYLLKVKDAEIDRLTEELTSKEIKLGFTSHLNELYIAAAKIFQTVQSEEFRSIIKLSEGDYEDRYVQPFINSYDLLEKYEPSRLTKSLDILSKLRCLTWWPSDIAKETFNAETALNKIYPIHNACKTVKLTKLLQEFIDYFMSHGYNINTKNNEGKTALHIACENQDVTIVEYLISQGSEVNLKDNEGKTPLHYASIHDEIDIINLLLSRGADKTTPDKKGLTPFSYAQKDETKEILKP